MKFDDIFQHLDEFGPYQRKLYFIICIPAITSAFHAVISVFLTGTPNHRCAIPGLDNDTYAIQNDYHRYLINLTIPQSEDETTTYEQCHVYNINISDSSTFQNPNKIQCTSWVYDRSIFKSTFTEKINLVCDDKLKTTHIQMIYFAGVFTGSILLGLLSDTIGRKKTLLLSILLMLVSSMALPWSPDFATFAVLRFFIGMSNIGIFMTGFVIESARWLVSKNKFQEARAIVYQAAKVNKTEMPSEMLDLSSIENPPGEGVWKIFTSRILFIRSIIIFFNWCVVSMVFYGLALNSGSLGLVELPAYIVCQVLLNVTGPLQPVTIVLAMLGKVGISAAFAIIYVWSAEIYPTVVRNSSMGLCSTSARIGGMISPYIADLSKVIPGNFGRALPLVIFGGLSVLAGILAVALPETMNMKLPETIEDGKQFGKNKNRYQCAIPGLDNDTYAVQVRFSNPDKIQCTSWVYDKSIFLSTFTEKVNLVCDDRFKTTHVQMIYFAGVFTGSIHWKKENFFNINSSDYHRWHYLWSPDFVTFAVLRFFIGMSNISMFMSGFVIGIELVGPSKRVLAGMVITYFWVIGVVLLAGIGILLTIVTKLLFRLIPESARWLVSKNKFEEARAIVYQTAKVNKTEMPTEMSVVSMGFYGLSLNSGNLGGDFYLNFFIQGLVELPAYVICQALLNVTGRRILHCTSMILGGICCICTIFTMLYADKLSIYTNPWSR
ncbi:LOW QUALITY PROTEIN: hypothetical protein KUTeg_008025 [Tegillarca granosa]|uniref:Uncharacterized protein n=1 Tax=Tegillarca granosa TaxID=220873 RepID=A0ABQ9FEZ6_TEGGR|nr:LOW QUALITY PROTEIN: hypothetical protein KUTeg_008025 [Tegillarca granosa]